MSSQLPELTGADQEFARIWGESTASVLSQLHGSPFTATPLPSTSEAGSGYLLWARFKASGKVEGEFAFQFLRSDAIRIAQLLTSETIDETAAFSETHVDAVSEAFRQFAGLASTGCKEDFGGDFQFSLEGSAAPEWEGVGRNAWAFASPKIDPLHWTLTISKELHASLLGAQAGLMQSVPAESKDVASPQESVAALGPKGDASGPGNLDLLLDVELEASLRFGQREMLLRDILELQPGSVIELDRRVQEPAELIVSGRVIAHGEVVIVDGNYGLRITDIAQPHQRLESVTT